MITLSNQLKRLLRFLLELLRVLAKKASAILHTLIHLLARFKKPVTLTIVVAAITILFTTIISMLFITYNHLYIPSLGTIRTYGVEAYGGDIKTIGNEQYIDWGTVYPGTSVNRTLYIRSKSNVPATLNITITNWTFQNSEGKNVTNPTEEYLSVSWNHNQTKIRPNQEIYLILTLQASSSTPFINYLTTNNVTEFNFDICIYAS